VAIDIKGTVKKHAKIVKELLPAHAISGCDTVGAYHGIGKGTVVKSWTQVIGHWRCRFFT